MSESYTVIFLLDTLPPTRIIFLKRALSKAFAPGLYTGIGGKIEAGEAALQGAYREMEEETGLINPTLSLFATCSIDEEIFLHYYWGIHSGALPECNEGDLEWVAIEHIQQKHIIPTTAHILTEWQRRNFDTNNRWEVWMRRTEKIDTFWDVDVITITDQLPEK